MEIEGKIAVVTGAAGGIGTATVTRFAELGATVIAAGRTETKLDELARNLGSSVIPMKLDVGSDSGVTQAIGEIERRFGRIDILVNNAGFGMFETVADAPVHRFADMMNVNFMGVVRCTKAALPGMLLRRSGHIVNVASLAGKVASAKAAGYAASKHAVLGFTNGLRQELIRTGVYVSAINPGPVETGFLGIADPGGQYAKAMERYMLKPDQVANGIVKAIRRRKREVDLPGLSGIAATAYLLFPGLLDRVAARIFNKK